MTRRAFTTRIELSGNLRARTAVSVGGMGGDERSDLALARNGSGAFYIPGTSLGGVLRERLRRLTSDPHAIADLFGCADDLTRQTAAPEAHHQAPEGGWASSIIVHDACVASEAVSSEIRDGVGLDRVSGAAADKIYYSRQVLPAGTVFPLRVVFEGSADRAEIAKTSMELLARSLVAQGLTVGAANTRGLGYLDVVDSELQMICLDLRSANDLQHWWRLRAGRHADVPKLAITAEGAKSLPHQWCFKIHWRPRGPIMVCAGVEGDVGDLVPLQTRGTRGWRALLPGSSIKGALRAHAERITRTLKREPLKRGDQGTSADRFLDQIAEREVEQSMGCPRADDEPTDRSDGGTWAPNKGAIAVLDCHHRVDCKREAVSWIPASDRRANASDEDPWGGYRRRTRNAVDRWTGGAMDSALFCLLEPPWETDAEGKGSMWEPIEIRVDLSRHRHDAARLEVLAMLWVLIGELARGAIPLGFATHRGQGDIEVLGIDIEDDQGANYLVKVDKQRLVAPVSDDFASLLRGWEAAWHRTVGGLRQ